MQARSSSHMQVVVCHSARGDCPAEDDDDDGRNFVSPVLLKICSLLRHQCYIIGIVFASVFASVFILFGLHLDSLSPRLRSNCAANNGFRV